MLLRATPEPSEVRVIVGDTHGDHVNLRRALLAAGAIDEHGERVSGYWTCHLGDVIHAAHGIQHDDLVTLNLALGWFDCLIRGNHETPFSVGVGRFDGMNRSVDCQADLNASERQGRWVCATAVDGYLLSHGGVHPRLLLSESDVFADVRRRDGLDDPRSVADAIEAAFERRLLSREPEPLFDWVGPYRGPITSREPHGGVFWCDWRELMAAERKRRFRSPLSQIVGHTPRRNVQRAFDGKYWCVDVGAALTGYVGVLVKRPGDSDWTPIRVGRGVPEREADRGRAVRL